MAFLESERQKFQKVPSEFLSKAATLMTAAFGFVAALAWNDAVQTLFTTFFPAGAGSVYAKFSYAFLVTILFTLVSFRLAKKVENEK